MPFEQVKILLQQIIGLDLSTQSAWRHTSRMAKALMANEEEELAVLETGGLSVAEHEKTVVVSVDGAYVPLREGKKTEAKTMAVGVLKAKPTKTGETKVGEISYFSRRQVSDEFTLASTLELSRREFYGAAQIILVSDGALWIEGFSKVHCPQAVHILDFYHASEYIAEIGRLVYGEKKVPLLWLEDKLHRLKHDGPRPVLTELALLKALTSEGQKELEVALNYLQTRIQLMDYPYYQQKGWPIGSGMVESANKNVVEARLRGAGMHWTLVNVNPMLSLRNTLCNDRFLEGWQKSVTYRRATLTKRYLLLAEQNTAKQQETAQSLPPPASSPVAVAEPIPTPPQSKPKKVLNGKPTSLHPWRRNFTPKVEHPSLN